MIGAAWEVLQEYPALHAVARRLEETLKADDRILGAAFYGSVGRGELDAFSDLDLFAVVADEHFEELLQDRHLLVERAGNVIFAFVAQAEYPRILVAVYEGPVELNLKLIPASRFVPSPGEHGWLIVKDSDGRLAQTEEAAKGLPLELPPQPEAPDAKFWLWCYRILARVQRGELWHAWDQLNDARALLMVLTSRSADRGYLGFRQWAQTLERADSNWLAATTCRLEASDILKAVSAAAGFYTALRARGGWAQADARFEGHVRRAMQAMVSRHLHSSREGG